MEHMTIKVVELNGNEAKVQAVSRRKIEGHPEAIIELVVRGDQRLTKNAARDIALAYLDPA